MIENRYPLSVSVGVGMGVPDNYWDAEAQWTEVFPLDIRHWTLEIGHSKSERRDMFNRL